MGVNGTPQPKRNKQLGGKKVDTSGGNKGGGCAPALVTVAALGAGWFHMLATSVGWIS